MKLQLQPQIPARRLEQPDNTAFTLDKRASPPKKGFQSTQCSFSVTQYNPNASFKTNQVIAVNPAAYRTPLKASIKVDKLRLPNISESKQRKERTKWMQHFEDTGAGSGAERGRKQFGQMCVYGSKRAFSSSDSSMAIQRKTAYGAGSPLSIIMEKRKLREKKAKKPSGKKQINESKQCKPRTVEAEPPKRLEAEQVASVESEEKAVKSKTIPDMKELVETVPITIPAADDQELQKFKEADGLRHFMWPITPLNLEEEEDAFFKSGCKINPQFTYQKPKLASRFLKSFKKPDGTVLPLAVKVIEAFLKTYGSESNFLSTDGGDVLTLGETKEVFQKYIDELNLTSYLKLDFSYNTVSPTTISHDSKTGQSIITIGLPIEYRKNRIAGVLNHEIGTHFLRNYNDQYQPWCGARKKHRLKNYLNTEEGLASLNQLFHIAITESTPPYLFQCALYYYTCYSAVSKSFVELFEDLAKYVDNPRRRFKTCLRAKRGLTDCAQHGGLYKDKVYFEGAVKILQKRRQIDLKALYAGKISVDDIQRPEILAKVNWDDMILPHFVKDKEQYMKALDKIAATNFIK